MKTKKVYLIRHGQSTANAVGHGPHDLGFDNDCEVPLTDEGKEQARLLGRHFKEQGDIINHVFCSPYKRAMDTFAHFCQEHNICAHKPLSYESRIRERTVLNHVGIVSEFHAMFRQPAYNQYFYKSNHVESMAEVCDRAASFIGTLERINVQGNILVFSHKMFIQAFEYTIRNQRGMPCRPEEINNIEKLDNCKYVTYEF